ncbi:MAG: hypothetical protein ABIR54_08830 [Burkholderiaceae bacterium]
MHFERVVARAHDLNLAAKSARAIGRQSLERHRGKGVESTGWRRSDSEIETCTASFASAWPWRVAEAAA